MASAEANQSSPLTERRSDRQGDRDSGQLSPSATCPICLDDCNDPRLLPCLHSACRACIDRMAVTAGADGEARKVKCPVCRTPCPITSQGASALPRNSIAPSKRRAKCDVCGSTEAKAWCSTCEVFVCNDHFAEHMRSTFGPTQAKLDHLFTMFDTPEEASKKAGVKDAATICPTHGQPLLYLCKRCDVAICGDCGLIGPHLGHNVVKVADMVAEKQAKVNDGVQKLRTDVEPRLVHSLENVDGVTSQLCERADSVRDKIEAATLRAVEAVKLGALRLRQEVEDEEQSRTKVLDGQRDGIQRQLEAVRGAASFGEEAASDHGDNHGASFPLLVAVDTRIAAICAEEIEQEPKHHPDLDFRPLQEEALVQKAVELVGEVLLYKACASHSTIKDGFWKKAISGEVVEAVVAVKDKHNTLVTSLRGAMINTQWLRRADQSPEDIPVEVSQTDTPGEYRLTTRPTVCGAYTLEVSINRVAMTQPITITIASRILRMSFDPNKCHESINLSDDRLNATTTRQGGGHVSVLGVPGMRRGRHIWKIRIGPTPFWHCVGVAAKSLPSNENNCSNSYSWTASGNRNGGTHDRRHLSSCEGNDCLQFQLDCDQHTLEIVNLRSNESHTITGLPDTELFVYAGLHQTGNSVSFE